MHARRQGQLSKSGASSNPNRPLPDGMKPGFYRDKATIKRLNMYKDEPDMEKMRKVPDKPARIEPDRKWFGNTRVIDQKQLDQYRQELVEAKKDPYTLLIRGRKLPMTLLMEESNNPKTINILDQEPYEETFGPKSKRKRPKLIAESLEGIAKKVEENHGKYDEAKDGDLQKPLMKDHKELPRDKRLEAGQSKRIWEELYKVLDSSDVVIEVIDARDPMGTRSRHVEEHLKKNAPQKHLILILNKCDLIPTWITKRWVKVLSREYPTLAFHASITNSFGKATLFQLLRQFDNFHKDKKNISVGFIGYPNVGKSSIINTLKKKNVCKAAPIPGETKVWQYITLTKRIYLIDCPGVVYDSGDSDADIVLKGVVRAEKLETPSEYIGEVLKRTKPQYIEQVYGIKDWKDSEDFMTMMAEKSGKLLKGGEADWNTVAKMILMDWQRGKIPFFIPPPALTKDEKEELKEEEEQKIKIEEQDLDKIEVATKFEEE
jgi:nuclear GTP-binding protein